MIETTDVPEYCRRLETYLCRKNEGHLVRIVGPAFERVSGWAAQGVPLKVAYRGIDRYCERYYAKGPRRRPVRIEFCEADILELFDDWRRAIGVAAGGGAERQRKAPLASHLGRVVARLIPLGASGERSEAFTASIASTVRQLDAIATDASHARGDRRAAIIARLAEIDRELTRAAVEQLDPSVAGALRREAEAELAPFAARMPGAARAAAVEAAFARLVREAVGLPTITYE